MDNPIANVFFTGPVRARLIADCNAMLQYTLSSGKALPQPVIDALGVVDRQTEMAVDLAALVELNGALQAVVAPATPRGLALIQDDQRRHPQLHMLGPVPSMRYLMGAVFVFFLLFCTTSLSPYVSTATVTEDIFNSSGSQLAWVLVFLLSAAGLGATFHALFDAYQEISDGTYDPKFDSIYWARIGLGLVAGLMLAELIPHAQSSTGAGMERPLLALLGGFSAEVVHRILDRLVGALESVFAPPAKTDPGLGDRDIRQRVAKEQALPRTSLATSFDRLLEQVAAGDNIDDARKRLLEMLSGGADAYGGLPNKAPQIAADAARGPATGSPNSAEPRVVADVTGGGRTGSSGVTAIIGSSRGSSD